MNVAGKFVRKAFVAVVVCLSLIGNCVYGTVLCFGADGHIEFESAFHDECREHVHSQSANHGHRPSEGKHEHDKHYHNGQCVDVPISFDLAKISRMTKQSNPAFAALAAGVIAPVEQSDCSEHLATSHAFSVTGYFAPLRTVILLV